MKPTEISASRWKTLPYLGGCLAFAAAAVLLVWDHDEGTGRLLFSAAVFGLSGGALAWTLIRPQRLLLDDEGFTILGGFVRKPKRIYWNDIDAFFIYRAAKGGKQIGFNFKRTVGVSPAVRLNRFFGVDGFLPKLWVESPEQVVRELNACRLRAEDKRDAKAQMSH